MDGGSSQLHRSERNFERSGAGRRRPADGRRVSRATVRVSWSSARTEPVEMARSAPAAMARRPPATTVRRPRAWTTGRSRRPPVPALGRRLGRGRRRRWRWRVGGAALDRGGRLTTGCAGALDDGVDAGAGAEEAPELAGAARAAYAAYRLWTALRLARAWRRCSPARLALVLSAAVLAAGSLGAVPKTPIEGTPSEPPTDSVCERPMRQRGGAAADGERRGGAGAEQLRASLAGDTPVPALGAHAHVVGQPCRRRLVLGLGVGGRQRLGEPLVEGRVLGRHRGRRGDAAGTRQAPAAGRRDGRRQRGCRERCRSGPRLRRRGRRGAQVDFADLDRGCRPSAVASSSPSWGSTRRMIRRGGQTPVRRDSSSSSLMFTIDRPVRLPAARPCSRAYHDPASRGSIEQRSGPVTAFEQGLRRPERRHRGAALRGSRPARQPVRRAPERAL